MLVFYNDDPMCIAHYDNGGIVIQLEFVDENNTVVINCNDTDYSEFFKTHFISTFNKIHARDTNAPDSARAKALFEKYAWKPRIGTYDMKDPAPEKIFAKKKRL
eukprot:8866597-Karenia_brevis.AAC.1